MSGKKSITTCIAVFIVLAAIFLGLCSINWIHEDQALARIEEITGTTDVVIIRHSNMNPIFGDPNDVTFELKVNGKYISARCTSGMFSEMVCRVYTDEGD